MRIIQDYIFRHEVKDMKKALIQYMKNHFDWTYSYNYCEYTFKVSELTKRALRIEPFITKYFNTHWEIFGHYVIITCNYFDSDLH